MRTKGKIASWNPDKGFGFITPNNASKRVFVHIKAFNIRTKEPKINQVVTYALSTDQQGRVCADGVTRQGERLSKSDSKKQSSKTILCSVIFLLIVGISTFSGKVNILIFPLYMVASLLTFLIYAMDKSAAKRDGWRTQESTLHLLSLIGGWPGTAIAQQKLRHKSKKESFRLVFWFTVAINIGVFTWLHTSNGVVFFPVTNSKHIVSANKCLWLKTNFLSRTLLS